MGTRISSRRSKATRRASTTISFAATPPTKRIGGRGSLPLGDGRAEVARDRLAQPAQDFGRKIPLLLGVDHVALCEDGAAPRDLRRAFGAAGDPSDLLDVVLQASGLLVEERSRARRAVAVRLVVDDPEIAGGGVTIEE